MARREGELIGNYRLVKLLEVGSYAEVYLGEHLVLGKYAAIHFGEHKLLKTHQAAIKIPNQNLLLPDDQNPFINEMKILSSLDHPHIIHLIDANINDTVPNLIMEYAPKGTLAQQHPKDATLPLPTVISYVKQIASALQYIHDKGIIHRDIKPHNILISKNNELLLGGFEYACFYLLADHISNVVGTPIYMSPEQLNDKSLPASDQYSLAVVTYELLCGNVPFQGPIYQMIYQQSVERPPSLREKNPSIPQAVEDVIMKALSKKPEDRYDSITSFAEALEKAATGKRTDGLGEQFGPYRTVHLLGQGDMGKVYFAEDSIQQSDGTWRKQSVAVKVLHHWYNKDMFRNHVRKMTKLQHDNILSTLLYGMKGDTPYLVMQYASQGTLLARHPRGSILPLETIKSYVKQIASALQYAHERDMLGDVRPKKMFVGNDNRILVSAFDIALNVGADPGRQVAKDYFEYRAPEQTQAFSSAACNQYALGIMVYEWLCGNVPFQGEAVQIVYQHRRVMPPSLRGKNPAIPHEVDEVVMKALAKDPEKRYESIQEFAEALEEAIAPPKANRFVLPDRTGEQFGKYILVRRLGQGGFAEVYLGQHVTLKKNFVAIKMLYAHLSAKQLETLENEAQVIAGLQHPSIVRVFDVDIERNTPFLVMDYAPKGTMRQFHARGSRLSLPTVVKYVKQIADALQHAHDQKIIHRDVKPENMLIGANDTIMLSDFGLAVIAHNTKSWKEQDKAGTAKYMAPEQYRRKAVPASDQYSLAVAAYEWLCGIPPFDEGEDEIQLVLQHLQDPVPAMGERGAVVSEEVEQVILKALAKEPTERFGSVKAFAEALENAAQFG